MLTDVQARVAAKRKQIQQPGYRERGRQASRRVRPPRHKVEAYGTPCEKGANSLWRRIIEAAEILTSPSVPVTVSCERDRHCRACEHATRVRLRKRNKVLHYCQCCNCPKWSGLGEGSDCEHKNRHALWSCPADPPKFGIWSGDGVVVPELCIGEGVL
jgi:hypothetical protein